MGTVEITVAALYEPKLGELVAPFRDSAYLVERARRFSLTAR